MGFLSGIRDKLSSKFGDILGMNEGIGFETLLEKLSEEENSTLYGELNRYSIVKDKSGKEFHIQLLSIARYLESRGIAVNPGVEYVAVRINQTPYLTVSELTVVNGKTCIVLHENLIASIENFKDMAYTDTGRATLMNLKYKSVKELVKEYYPETSEEKHEDEKAAENTYYDMDSVGSVSYDEYKSLEIFEYAEN